MAHLKKLAKKSKSLNSTPSQSYWASLAIWDYTATTRHKWTRHALTPAR